MFDFEIGDLVWAKMKGFSPWPAKIVEPVKDLKVPPKAKEQQFCVRFFGTNDHSWILISNILTFEDGKKKFGDKGTGSFKKAIQEMYTYAKDNPPKKKTPIAIEDSSEISVPKVSSHPKIKSTTPKANGVAKLKTPTSSNHKLSITKDKSQKSASIKRVPKKDTSSKKHRISTDSLNFNSDDIYSHSEKNGDQYSMLYSMDVTTTYRRSYKSYSFGAHSGFYDDMDTTNEIEYETKHLKEVDIPATELKIGFLGLGVMGSAMVRHLVRTGHKVSIWNRSSDKCSEFIASGAKVARSPEEVVEECSITFSCLSDLDVAKNVFYGNHGVLQAMGNGKGFVEMTSIDPVTSFALNEAVELKKGRYLEVSLLGSRKEAEEGNLLLLAAGNRDLFQDCYSCFRAIGETVYFLGPVGKAIKMNLVVSTVMGSCYSAVAEAMALADRCGISLKDVVEIFQCGDLQCPAIIQQGKSIVESSMFMHINMPLQHVQRNMHIALDVGEKCSQPLPTAAASHEVLKHAKRKGYGEHDVSVIYKTARFH